MTFPLTSVDRRELEDAIIDGAVMVSKVAHDIAIKLAARCNRARAFATAANLRTMPACICGHHPLREEGRVRG